MSAGKGALKQLVELLPASWLPLIKVCGLSSQSRREKKNLKKMDRSQREAMPAFV